MKADDLDDALDAIVRDCFCLGSRMTARAVTRAYNEVLAPLDLEVTEFTLLGVVARGRGGSITELAERLAYERTTLVRNFKRLVERGLIERDGDRGRAVNYRLTPAGRALLDHAVPIWQAAQRATTDRLASGQASAVRHALEALRRAVR